MGKLFYTVSQQDAASFAADSKMGSVIGFVAPEEGSEFGYIIVNGKQYGMSYYEYVSKMNELDGVAEAAEVAAVNAAQSASEAAATAEGVVASANAAAASANEAAASAAEAAADIDAAEAAATASAASASAAAASAAEAAADIDAAEAAATASAASASAAQTASETSASAAEAAAQSASEAAATAQGVVASASAAQTASEAAQSAAEASATSAAEAASDAALALSYFNESNAVLTTLREEFEAHEELAASYFATKEELSEAIGNVDFSALATKEELEAATASHSAFATKEELAAAIEKHDDYATKEELEAHEELAASYYATKKEATVSVDNNANYFIINKEKFIFNVSNNVISVSKYVASSLGTLTLSTINSTPTATGGGSKYVGSDYKLTTGIDVTSTSQTLTIPVNNSTTQDCKVAVHNGTSYIYQDESWQKHNGNLSVNIDTIMADVTNVVNSGTVEWKNYDAQKVSTTGHKTFSVYLTENNREYNASTDKKTITQSTISASATLSAKLPVFIATDSYFTNVVKVFDVTYGNRNAAIGDYTFTASNGMMLYIAIPEDLSSHCTADKIKLIDTSMNLPVDGSFNIKTNSDAAYLPTTYSGVPTTIKYYFTSTKTAFTGADGFKVTLG